MLVQRKGLAKCG